MTPVARRLCLVGVDILLISLAYVLAFWLRLSDDMFLEHLVAIQKTLPLLILVSLYVHLRLGLFNAILKYASVETAVAVLKAVAISVPSAAVLFFLLFRLQGVPRSVFVIYAMAAFIFIGGSRLAVRWWAGRGEAREGKRVLLFGADDDGVRALRALRESRTHDERAVAFLDDDPAKRGRDVLGLPVLGGVEALDGISGRLACEEVWVADGALPGDRLRALVAAAERAGLAVKVLARGGSLEVQPPKIEDLLRRPPRKLDRDRMRAWVRGRRVLVTGAGGSIGSELCRQLAELGPERLAICDASELNLFNADRELRARHGGLMSKPYLVNVRDEAKVRAMFAEERPSIVFHAAAYKHVPLVELNPCEGVVNNVKGTLVLAEAALEHGAADFVFISTDKAVRPSSVMGATKRIGELLCRALNGEGKTRFEAVRFGNVLGSSGSVIQVFQEQIRRGGPVTVTHPDMTRYFMLISEAVELVIQAGSLGQGGEVFLLDMGEPVRIRDVAETLIRLMTPPGGKPAEIVHSGVRPGEKIREELLIHENDRRTEFPDLRLDAEPPGWSWKELRPEIQRLIDAAEAQDAAAALERLGRLAPRGAPAPATA